ncbi:MAG: MBL fold metallo-hydrolase [Syntrophorhabdus sp.]|jgi:glyoxylase-like metal-dependent hydrolase (beta-lactamase superfamily II)|nr:MBL fold metallo-hydrolase [Syntrophorhabdus sp.]
MKPKRIEDGVFLVGSSNISDSRDCMVYLLDLGELIMIDTGAGPGVSKIISNIRYFGFDPAKLSTIILTHCHIDHVGGAHEFKKRFDVRLVMHNSDIDVVERGDTKMTAAHWYGVPFAPLKIDKRLMQEEERLSFGQHELICFHTPGHTPGSISVYINMSGKRILFGQDIHGPFLPEFGSDIVLWQASMKKLLSLKADVLCEGHFGVFRPNDKVTEYIERYLEEYGDQSV